MYYCEQCESECVIVSDNVICTECNYEVTRDSLDKADLLESLQAIIEPDKPDKYGYNAAGNAMNDDIRAVARKVIARVTS